MTRSPLPPTFLTDQGRRLRVTRAWPGPGESRLTIECEDAGQRRAGVWDGQRANLQPVGTDPRLPELAELARGGVVVSHRPGKRAVVQREREFIKVVRRGRADTILGGITRADAFAERFRTPEVLAHTSSTVTFRALEGSSLHEPGALGPRQWSRAWSEVLDAWSQSVSAPGAEPTGHPSEPAAEHSAEQEIGVLAHWTRLVEPYVQPADPLWRSVERVSAELAQLPQVNLRPAHRDLHDKQLLWSPQSGPGLLDVDTACRADPALDLGNLRAHARLRLLQRVWEARAAQTVIGAVDATAAQLHVPAETLAVYERAAMLRLGCVYAVRPAYLDVAATMRAIGSAR